MQLAARQGKPSGSRHKPRWTNGTTGEHRRIRDSPRIDRPHATTASIYLIETVAPASSSSFLSFSASSFEMPSLTLLGTPSTRSLASLRPRPVARADDLDHADLLVAEAFEHDVEFGLLGRGCRGRRRRRRRGHHHARRPPPARCRARPSGSRSVPSPPSASARRSCRPASSWRPEIPTAASVTWLDLYPFSLLGLVIAVFARPVSRSANLIAVVLSLNSTYSDVSVASPACYRPQLGSSFGGSAASSSRLRSSS